ncbi:MAG TPA: hypothetical protein EYG21_03400, partial [Nitrospinaceae bacterium]|nr:hypothetical protein [Nitrospinaceae bacterium]
MAGSIIEAGFELKLTDSWSDGLDKMDSAIRKVSSAASSTNTNAQTAFDKTADSIKKMVAQLDKPTPTMAKDLAKGFGDLQTNIKRFADPSSSAIKRLNKDIEKTQKQLELVKFDGKNVIVPKSLEKVLESVVEGITATSSDMFKKAKKDSEELTGDYREEVMKVSDMFKGLYQEVEKAPEDNFAKELSKDFSDLWQNFSRVGDVFSDTKDRINGDIVDVQTKFDSLRFDQDAAKGPETLAASFREVTASLKEEAAALIAGGANRKAVFRGVMTVIDSYQKKTKELVAVNKDFKAVYFGEGVTDGRKPAPDSVLGAFKFFGMQARIKGKRYTKLTSLTEFYNITMKKSAKIWKSVATKVGESSKAIKEFGEETEKSTNAAAKMSESLGKDYFQVRQDLHELGVTYGFTNKQIDDNVGSMFELSIATGVGSDKIVALEKAFRNTGMSLADFSEQTRSRLILLSQTYGITADDMAKFQSAAVFSVQPMED